MASLNVLIILSKEVEPGWCFHIAIHIYIKSLTSVHADNIHEFRSSRSSRSRVVIFGCAPYALRASCSGRLTYCCVCVCVCVGAQVNVCISLFVCAFPRGFLWCYRGNWMCDAHQKSPLALGKRSFNPSVPQWKAQPKGRLILSTGKHQMVPCSLHHSLRLSAAAVASEGSPLTCNDMTIHMRGSRRGTYRWGMHTLLVKSCWISDENDFWVDWRSALGQVLKSKSVKLFLIGGNVP